MSHVIFIQWLRNLSGLRANKPTVMTESKPINLYLKLKRKYEIYNMLNIFKYI